MTSIAARLEELPTLMWIGLAILGFFIWWPLGLVVSAYMLWSGRMRCCGFDFGRWKDRAHHMGQAYDGLDRPQTSGNRAFDDYRAETLQRLEEEQRAFREYLHQLRAAKDRAEFDQFMAERRSWPESASQAQGLGSSSG